MPFLASSSFISFLKYTDTLIEQFTTTEADEVIMFLDGTDKKNINGLLIENTGSVTMYVRILPWDYILVIPSGESRTYDFALATGIQIMGASGQTLRWSGCAY